MTTPFKINTVTHLLESVTYRASPHHDERPDDMPTDLIVVHGISLPPGEFGSPAIEAFFCGHLDTTAHPAFAEIATLRVSAHLLIKRSGDIIQFVPFNKRAWHAGQSAYHGRERCNDFSIGIELEGTDEVPYETVQYLQLSRVIHALVAAYPSLSAQHVVGHVDIAPGRKTDPGYSFDWTILRGLLA